jgi:DNA-binding SARP family transcriptional activator/TolB-like protein
MAQLECKFLGAHDVARNGAALNLPGRKARALLAYLALNPDSRHTRDKLATLLWGDRGDEQARHSLRQCVHSLRQVLGGNGGEAPILLAEGDELALVPGTVSVDAREFERLAAGMARRLLEQAAALYGGDLLDGLDTRSEGFDEWLAGERARLCDLACDVLARLAEMQAESGELEIASETARRLIALDPLREEGHRLMMRLYDQSGRRTLALRQYQSCADLLRRDLDAEPSAETNRLFEAIRAQHESGEIAPAAGARRSRLRRAAAPAAAIVLIIAAGFAARQFMVPKPPPPQIIVLPFEDLSPPAARDGFVDGVTEDITTALSIVSEMRVIARHTALAYRGKEFRIPETARKLGVRYVLSGSVRRRGDRVRVTAELVEATTGERIWAERYDREARQKDVFDLQDEITQDIITALQVELTEGEQERIRRIHGTRNLQAWVTAADGLRHLRRLNPQDNLRARQLYQKAIELDPSYPGAWDGHAWTHLAEAMFGWSERPEASLVRAAELAQKTKALDPGRPGTYALLGMIQLYFGRHDEAIALGEKAIALSPSGADVAALLAFTLSYAGEPERSIALSRKAMTLSPMHPMWYAWSLGRSLRLSGDYGRAIEALKSRREGDPDSLPPHVDLVIAYIWSGLEGPARIEARRVMQMAPVFSVARWARGQPYQEKALLEREIAALRQAGLPE